MCELYAEDQEDFPIGYPLSYLEIAHETSLDAAIQKAQMTKPDRYKAKQCLFADKSFTLLVVTREGKIVLSKCLTKQAVKWYHNNLYHHSETRTELALGQYYCFPGMCNLVNAVCCKCANCRLNKNHQLKYGKIPPKDPDGTPWDVQCIDLIGPYTITVDLNGEKKEIILHCLITIDPATHWMV
jgi:Integrase zinc binding domain